MEIILAEHSGSCWGVKRSIKIVFDVVRQNGGPTYSLGPLIHNPQVVSKMEQEGVRVIDTLNEVKGTGTVIIRTHGTPPAIKQQLEDNPEIKIVDATCPIVSRSQRIAGKLGHEGYKVIIVGDRDHPEVNSLGLWKPGTMPGANSVLIPGGAFRPKNIVLWCQAWNSIQASRRHHQRITGAG